MATDWLAGMLEHTNIADRMAQEVPRALAVEGLSAEEASRLFRAVEERADAFDRFFADMQNADDADDRLFKAGELLEELFSQLSLQCASKSRELRGLPPIDPR